MPGPSGTGHRSGTCDCAWRSGRAGRWRRRRPRSWSAPPYRPTGTVPGGLFQMFFSLCLSSRSWENKTPCRSKKPTRCQGRHRMDRPTAGFFLRISLKKGILVLRCGRCPLCRWAFHLRRCRGIAVPLHCRILFSVSVGTCSRFGKFCFVSYITSPF